MMKLMRTAILALAVSSLPLQAGEDTSDMSEGMSLMEQGARLLLRGLLAEIEPTLREMEPALRELQQMIDDLNAYHPPEILPNGDIILRRKVPLEPGEEIDL